MDREIIKTEDGSSSIYVPSLNETYHSRRGGLLESEYVYIRAGLQYYLNNLFGDESSRIQVHNGEIVVNILEVGLGTGMNMLLSILYSQFHNVTINYHAVEPYPLTKSEYEQLNLPEIISKYYSVPISDIQNWFEKIHKTEFDIEEQISPKFKFKKIQTKFIYFKSNEQYDIIYYDAFAPSKQPSMWTKENLSVLQNLTKSDSILVTYCSQGNFKRTMAEFDFVSATHQLRGPFKKREMTRFVFK